MYFKHVAFCFLSWVTKHPLKDHRDIGHEIYRIVMNDHLPRNVEFVLVLRLDVVGGRFDGRSTAALELHRAYHGTSFRAISLGRIGWALMKKSYHTRVPLQTPEPSASTSWSTFLSAARIRRTLLAFRSSKP